MWVLRVKEEEGREVPEHGLVNFIHKRQLPGGESSLSLRRVAKTFSTSKIKPKRQCFDFSSVLFVPKEVSRFHDNTM